MVPEPGQQRRHPRAHRRRARSRRLRPRLEARGERQGPDRRLHRAHAVRASPPRIPNPNGLTLADIADAFQSERAAWSDGSPIRVILRPRSESDTALMGELFPGLASAMAKARQRPDIPVAATDQDNADMAEQTPGSLDRIDVDAARAGRAQPARWCRSTASSRRSRISSAVIYRYAKPLHFVVPARPAPLVERFIAFLRSPAGQRALREAHVL